MTARNIIIACILLVWVPALTVLSTVKAQNIEDPFLNKLLQISKITEFAWSPQGNKIVYTSNKTGTDQLFLLDLDSMAIQQLTSHASPTTDPQWSPDGESLLYLTDPGWQERYEVWEYSFATNNSKKILADVGAIQRNVRWSPDGSKFVLETNASGNFDIAFWDPANPVLRPLVTSQAGESNPEWNPDGTSITFLSRNSVWMVDVEGGEPEQIFNPGLGAVIQTPVLSPDGDKLLFVTDLSGYWNIGIYSISSGDWHYLAPEPYEQTEPAWSPDGRYISFISTNGFDKRVVIADLEQGDVRYLTEEGTVASSPAWNPDGERLGYLMSSPQQTQELWMYDDGQIRQLTDSMAGWTPSQFSSPEKHTYLAREEFEIPGLLYKPVDFDPNKRYPAVIVIHGGFAGQWINNFDLLAQYLLHRGMVLFYPNPRGGGGYGRMYERLNDGDWGGGDVDDLIRAHEYLKTLPFVDEGHVAIWGGSYGGYLTYALVTTAPERFQAAVVRAGINDLRSQVMERVYSPVRLNNTSSYARQLGGLPDENPDFYKDRSPMTWVEKVQTPMLIMHGLRDNRVSPSQSQKWVQALQDNGVPVIYVEYPVEDHSLLRYKTTISDQLQNMTNLFERYLGLKPVN